MLYRSEGSVIMQSNEIILLEVEIAVYIQLNLNDKISLNDKSILTKTSVKTIKSLLKA